MVLEILETMSKENNGGLSFYQSQSNCRIAIKKKSQIQ
jgi:hypothetical protein